MFFVALTLFRSGRSSKPMSQVTTAERMAPSARPVTAVQFPRCDRSSVWPKQSTWCLDELFYCLIVLLFDCLTFWIFWLFHWLFCSIIIYCCFVVFIVVSFWNITDDCSWQFKNLPFQQSTTQSDCHCLLFGRHITPIPQVTCGPMGFSGMFPS